MTPVNIDFAPASLRRSLWRSPPVYYLLATTGLVLCVSAALVISTTRAQKAREQRQQAYQTSYATSAPVPPHRVPQPRFRRHAPAPSTTRYGNSIYRGKNCKRLLKKPVQPKRPNRELWRSCRWNRTLGHIASKSPPKVKTVTTCWRISSDLNSRRF